MFILNVEWLFSNHFQLRLRMFSTDESWISHILSFFPFFSISTRCILRRNTCINFKRNGIPFVREEIWSVFCSRILICHSLLSTSSNSKLIGQDQPMGDDQMWWWASDILEMKQVGVCTDEFFQLCFVIAQ